MVLLYFKMIDRIFDIRISFLFLLDSRSWKHFLRKMSSSTRENYGKSSSNSAKIIVYPSRACHGNKWSKKNYTVLF